MDIRGNKAPGGWTAPPPRNSVAGTALIDKAFRILEIVGSAPEAVTLAHLLRETGWPRATLHRILAAILAKGFLRHDPLSNGYALGFRFMEIAQNVWSEHDLVSIAGLELRRLRDMTGETAYLAVPIDGAMMGLGKFEGAHRVRSAARLGIRKPMHCTSQGKAVLAFLPEAALRELLRGATLEAFTPHTITDAARLRAQLSIVRHRGYAIEDEEIIVGNRCVGAPVLDEAGRPVAAISVAGPIWRLSGERAEQLGPEIAAVAKLIGQQLRSRAPSQRTGDSHPLVHPGSDHAAFYGADPAWDREGARWMWTDRLGPALFATGASDTAVHSLPLEMPIRASVALREGGLQVWQEDVRVRFDGRSFGAPERAGGDMLAAARHPDGALWTASAQAGGCAIHVEGAEADGGWSVASRIEAMAWSPDGQTLYASAPGAGVIYRMEAGGRTPRVFSRVPSVSGEPRAVAVDPDCRLWATLYDGWSAVRFSQDGEIEQVAALPVPRPSGIAFGGPDGREAFVTTARVGLARDVLDNAPLSGRVLTWRT